MRLFHAVFCYGSHNHLLESHCRHVDEILGFQPVRQVAYYGQGTPVVKCGIETRVLGFRECWEHLPLKTYGLIRHALEDPDWDVLLKTDANAIVASIDLTRLEEHDLIGHCHLNANTDGTEGGCTYHYSHVSQPILREPFVSRRIYGTVGGPAYAMNRRLAQFIADKGVWAACTRISEDRMVSEAADEMGSPAAPGIGYYSDENGYTELHCSRLFNDQIPVVQMRSLGDAGQWGNQVFQYAFIRTYAKRHGIRYELPKWAGQTFFGHCDPPVKKDLPPFTEERQPTDHASHFGVPMAPDAKECHDRDFRGYAQFHTSWYAPDKQFIQSLFRLVPPQRAVYRPLVNRLRDQGDTVISLHLRRGDAGRMIFFLTPIIWCLDWLHENWSRFTNPVLYLATETLELKKWFQRWNVVTMDDLGIQLQNNAYPQYNYPYDEDEKRARQMTFMPDWYVMQHSDVVVAAESTFSVSAAWTNRNLKEFWRARLSKQGFEQCDVWDMDV